MTVGGRARASKRGGPGPRASRGVRVGAMVRTWEPEEGDAILYGKPNGRRFSITKR